MGFSPIPYIQNWLHIVWATEKRLATLQEPGRSLLFEHIHQNARTKAIHLNEIGGYVDHVHCLISLTSGQTIDKVVQLLKGESSFWVNKNSIFKQRLAWQDEYFAVSISQSLVHKVKAYIQNQEEHHKRKTFQEEYDEFIRLYGFGRDVDGSIKG